MTVEKAGTASFRVGGLYHAGPAFATLAAAVQQVLLAERERWALWAPVLLGAGIGAYFALPFEWVAGWPALILGLVLGVFAYRMSGPILFVALASGAALALGFAVAALQAEQSAAPVVPKRLGPVWVEGRVRLVEPRTDAVRVTLDRLTIEGLPTTATPERVRVTLRKPGDALQPGEHARLRAILLPPPAPAVPGGFDFARMAWFQRIGAVGFATLGAQRLPGDGLPPSILDRFNFWIAGTQHSLAQRIMALIPGPGGAVAAALMTGEQGAIPADVLAAFRDSGLAHILSISGLHLAIVAGVIFFAVRAILAAIEPVALHSAIKKWAAAAAILGAGAYMLLSGSAVATERSFIMTGLMLLAIIFDRLALSLRNVALSAIAVLVLHPASLLDPGFQMSFAAVTALIALLEEMRERQAGPAPERGLTERGLRALTGIAITTLIAGFATAPYAAYHFGRFVDYGLVANLLGIPLTSLVLMPLGVAAFALMPFGAEALALIPMGWGIDLLIAIGRLVASWPGAVVVLPATPLWGLLAVTLGALWLGLWRQSWRWIGLLPVLVGLISPWLTPRPDILVDGQGRLIALVRPDGSAAISDPRARGMVPEAMARRLGTDKLKSWREDDGRLRCDSNGCILRAAGQVIALPRRDEAIEADCRIADIVIASVPVREKCPSARLIIDRFDLWRHGAHAIWLREGAAPRVEHVRGLRGERYWVLNPAEESRKARRRAAAAERDAQKETPPVGEPNDGVSDEAD